MLVLHGILGTKSNWRALIKRVIATNPTWGALLVDLRNHGESRGFPPPHTLEAAAQDLVRLTQTVEVRVDAIVGHSYGGKVAMAYARAVHGELHRLVVVDSTPGARPDATGSEGTLRVVELLAEMRGVFPTREAFVAELLAGGQSRELATWLAMNLERVEGEGATGFRFGLDIDAVCAMLDDYLAQDLWDVVARPPGRMGVEVLIGADSTVVDADDRTRFAHIAAEQPARVHVHLVHGAGHWVHVDQPDATVALLAEAFRADATA